MFIIDLVFTLALFFLAFYSMFTVFGALKIAFKTVKGELDELERKIVFDSLAYSMLTIFALHAAQFILGIIFNFNHGNRPFIPFISSGIPFGTVFGLETPSHFEAIFFDALVFTIIYKLLQKKFAFKN
ncbi:hypothetical protein [Enterococcus rivorum]|uniref:Uncharacterized protein n=2 Tax=Enterococcus rivorum TaxID=762845 RepID=A0A1E5KV24_9ENTE|nr:hypothetical protein [Enterococcus rivorum]MBP2100341.1 hypothetical protein [Enterococcus rivorum]OEH81747.1 hypothetical protein BCR26_15650 [Enterococcus rivorum]